MPKQQNKKDRFIIKTDSDTHIVCLLQGGGEGGGKDGDFMSEAKDWAGELISGQTGTGRILVRSWEI